MVVYEGFENLMQHIVEVAILFFEFVGVIVIIISGLKGFYYYIRRRPDMKLTCCRTGIQALQRDPENRYCKRFQGNCNSCRNYCAPCGFDLPDSLGNQAGESQP